MLARIYLFGPLDANLTLRSLTKKGLYNKTIIFIHLYFPFVTGKTLAKAKLTLDVHNPDFRCISSLLFFSQFDSIRFDYLID